MIPRDRSLIDVAWYYSFTTICRLFHSIYAPIESYGTENIPRKGKVLIISNHQSLLDPFILAITCPRRLFYIGKSEIFDIPIVGQAAWSYGISPVDREHIDLSAAKTALRILRQGNALVILPEATRSPSGEILEFKPGFVKVAIRSHTPIVPTAIVGSWSVWPKHRKFPLPGRIKIAYGESMDLEQDCKGTITLDLQKQLSEKVRSQVIALANSLRGK